jgi:hypothetical protein
VQHPFARELIAAAPNDVMLLGLTHKELEILLLRLVCAASDDQTRRMLTRDAVIGRSLPLGRPHLRLSRSRSKSALYTDASAGELSIR